MSLGNSENMDSIVRQRSDPTLEQTNKQEMSKISPLNSFPEIWY